MRLLRSEMMMIVMEKLQRMSLNVLSIYGSPATAKEKIAVAIRLRERQVAKLQNVLDFIDRWEDEQ